MGGKYVIMVVVLKVLVWIVFVLIMIVVFWLVMFFSCVCYLDNLWTIARVKVEIVGEEIVNVLFI